MSTSPSSSPAPHSVPKWQGKPPPSPARWLAALGRQVKTPPLPRAPDPLALARPLKKGHSFRGVPRRNTLKDTPL